MNKIEVYFLICYLINPAQEIMNTVVHIYTLCTLKIKPTKTSSDIWLLPNTAVVCHYSVSYEMDERLKSFSDKCIVRELMNGVKISHLEENYQIENSSNIIVKRHGSTTVSKMFYCQSQAQETKRKLFYKTFNKNIQSYHLSSKHFYTKWPGQSVCI